MNSMNMPVSTAQTEGASFMIIKPVVLVMIAFSTASEKGACKDVSWEIIQRRKLSVGYVEDFM